MTPEQKATDDEALAAGAAPRSWRPTTYKRYSNGVVRLYSFIEVEEGRREWLLVAKRVGNGPWCGVPNARARRKALAELRGRPMPRVVHILHHGRALCGLKDTPLGHVWVALTEAELATCLGCQRAHAAGAATSGGRRAASRRGPAPRSHRRAGG